MFKIFILLLLNTVSILPQVKVAITIDDVPNTKKYKRDANKTILLDRLDSLKVPAAIFINEKKVYQNAGVEKNLQLLEKWISSDLITPANHTYSHPRYSKTEFEEFVEDVKKGEHLTRPLAKKYGKELKHFRFPFNNLGKDSLQQAKIAEKLDELGYQIAPFTIESSDWMFNFLYRYYQKKGDMANAKEIGDTYVARTVEYFSFYDSLSVNEYGRIVDHIFLCHDNELNADYLPEIITNLRDKGYKFITYDEALKDTVYNQKTDYYEAWGVSWFYRWMTDKKMCKEYMQKEPDITEYFKLYNKLSKEKY